MFPMDNTHKWSPLAGAPFLHGTKRVTRGVGTLQVMCLFISPFTKSELST